MSWWPPSWLPNLPSFDLSLPAGLQRHFLSYILNKFLGHFVKNGQLDARSIDSQIGSGYVQVKDIELDPTAINALLVGLPFELHSSHVEHITTRIPWPNPLTSTLGLSLQSLHLTLDLLDNPANSQLNQTSNLADSVASVAAEFLHHELSPGEEATLRESFHPDRGLPPDPADYVPGGIDPFLNTEEFAPSDTDPDGVGIFASLIERLLARFAFDAADTRITIRHPGRSSFTLIIPHIRYETESETSSANEAPTPQATLRNNATGETRTITISGVEITTLDLRPEDTTKPAFPSIVSSVTSLPPHPPYGRIPREPHSRSPSPDSDIDDETQMMMSQSIPFLPPQPLSSSSMSASVVSSMYHSAISEASLKSTTVREPIPEVQEQPLIEPAAKPEEQSSPNPQDQPPPSSDAPPPQGAGIPEETIVSFGSDPIIIRLTTPPPSESRPEQRKVEKRDDSLRLSVTTGMLSFALRARHIQSLTELVASFGSISSTPPTPQGTTPASPLLSRLNVSVHVRGVVGLLLLSKEPSYELTRVDFFHHQLIPPKLPYRYLRIHADGISVSFSQPPGIGRGDRRTSGTTRVDASLTTTDLTVFLSKLSSGSSLGSEHTASPILITDPNILIQYTSSYAHPVNQHNPYPNCPAFDVSDWTSMANKSKTPKPSYWRARIPQNHSQQRMPMHGRGGPVGVPGLSSSPGQSNPDFLQKSPTHSPPGENVPELRTYVEARIAPLHVFVDLGALLSIQDYGLLEFLQDSAPTALHPAKESASEELSEEISDEDEKDTPPATPRRFTDFSRMDSDRQRERQRLEQMVLDDLDLKFDYRSSTPKQSPQSLPSEKVKAWREHDRSNEKEGAFQLSIKVPVIRVEIRCPQPPRFPDSRSGALILDLHNIHLSPGGLSGGGSVPKARFADLEVSGDVLHSSSRSAPHNIFLLDVGRIVVAHSPAGEGKAYLLVSLGPLSPVPISSSVATPRFGGMSPLPGDQDSPPPAISISVNKTTSKSRRQKPGSLIVTTDIPSVYINLNKPLLDGLQYWVDDVSQLVERIFGDRAKDSTSERGPSRNSSLLGSQYFAQSSGGSEAEFSHKPLEGGASETVVKLSVSEGFVVFNVPRAAEKPGTVKPFDISVSYLDCLVELSPDGKEETVITLAVRDINVQDTNKANRVMPLLSPVEYKDLRSNPRPSFELHLTSKAVRGTNAKESRVKVSLHSFTYNLFTDFDLAADLGAFFKAPPDTFETVVPAERTKLSVHITDGSVKAHAPTHPGVLIFYVGDLTLNTDIVGDAPSSLFRVLVPDLSILLLDDLDSRTDGLVSDKMPTSVNQGVAYRKSEGFALLAELQNLDLRHNSSNTEPDVKVVVNGAVLRLHLCADTIATLSAFIGHLSAPFKKQPDPSVAQAPVSKRAPMTITEDEHMRKGLLRSLDEEAFKMLPEVGAAPDMINDDLPSNPDYLDESFGAAAGFREIRDDEFDEEDIPVSNANAEGVTSDVGGETIRMLSDSGIKIVEHHFDNLPPDGSDDTSHYGETSSRVRLHQVDIQAFLYDGYDWARTRKTIENQVKLMRRRLAKIRQLLASGETQTPEMDQTSTLLFNSVYIGLDKDVEDMEREELMAAIDGKLAEEFETASQSSWQSLPVAPSQSAAPKLTRILNVGRNKRLTRSRGPSIEFKLSGVDAEIDQYLPKEPIASRTLVTVRDFEILDHIKTSTWRAFLTEMRSDSRGNVRESGSNMVRVELRDVKPIPGNPSVESRLRAKFLPLRLNVDQDALDFLKQFFNFKDPSVIPPPTTGSPEPEPYFQCAEVFPVDISLDYKPRRVDYRALKEGRTIELMNFFHFDNAEMTLRHITLYGVTGWPRLFDLLNDIWTPDVKATQLVDVISGVAPIRSVVNVGSGVADLVLLPIAQYKKDGRVLRGVQKGATSFLKSTAMEAIRLGARLATGTQVILEQAENVLGTKDPVTAEALQLSPGFGVRELGTDDEDTRELISKYAEQPQNVREGLHSGYKSLKRNVNSAAQTILAVPMEIYESSNEGPVRAVVRAVPIAVLRPMIGASEAVSKTLFGLHNTLDPNSRHETETKYKQR
ncbi:hypothetical protein BDM02DRAFT_3092255 [Thelephora ganbajun]|uniref:Uncharacterized protein n=1 Tax=Thelephora ganbajun TaxID=370292 RepID=A0ACB6ZMJ7_THEGA|nr:hypothetical protein BDM02DRAFT_3092255 [Thelephora ganbajun]